MMNRALFVIAVLASTAIMGIGCKPNDLGTECRLVMPVCVNEDVADCYDPELQQIEYQEIDPEDRDRDYIATGVTDCEHFNCVSSAGFEEQPYCSRACLDNEQCRGGVRDLVCRELVLDDSFIADLCEQLGEERCEQVFGQLRSSRFCAVPLTE